MKNPAVCRSFRNGCIRADIVDCGKGPETDQRWYHQDWTIERKSHVVDFRPFEKGKNAMGETDLVFHHDQHACAHPNCPSCWRIHARGVLQRPDCPQSRSVHLFRSTRVIVATDAGDTWCIGYLHDCWLLISLTVGYRHTALGYPC